MAVDGAFFVAGGETSLDSEDILLSLLVPYSGQV